jgi:glycosyltransferase involved in cell wall biosynthesis
VTVEHTAKQDCRRSHPVDADNGPGTGVRILFHVSGSYVDMLPDKIRQLSVGNELHLVLEVSPRLWSTNALGLPMPASSPAVVECREWLLSNLPSSLHSDFSQVATVHAAVFPASLGASSLRVARSCARLTHAISPDVIHLDGETFRSLLWLPFGRAPWVLCIHEPWLPSGAGQPEVKFAMVVLRTVARVLVVHSDEALRELERAKWRRSRPIVVAPFGSILSFPHFSSGNVDTADQERSVLFAGRLTPRKGVDTFVEAARLAAQRLSDVRFEVRGMPVRGLVPPESEDLAGRCQLAVNSFRQSPAELASAFRSAEFVVVPYRDARQSGVILTAFGFRKPVVAARVGGLVEQVRDCVTGVLVPVGRADLLADTIVELLNHPERLVAMSEAIGEENEGRLSWRPFGRALQAAYAAALGRPERWSGSSSTRRQSHGRGTTGAS